ncbi:hypothetical protein PRBEI_2001859400 [Prionailurus iriomotensis]
MRGPSLSWIASLSVGCDTTPSKRRGRKLTPIGEGRFEGVCCSRWHHLKRGRKFPWISRDRKGCWAWHTSREGKKGQTVCLEEGPPPVSAIVSSKWLKTITFHSLVPRPIVLLSQPE